MKVAYNQRSLFGSAPCFRACISHVRTNEDLPLPDGPAMTTEREAFTRAKSRSPALTAKETAGVVFGEGIEAQIGAAPVEGLGLKGAADLRKERGPLPAL